MAARLGLSGSRETQRRRVRAIVEMLRSGGSWVIATRQAGYWLTRDERLWRAYNDGRQIDAKQILAETSGRKKRLAGGQGHLFDMRTRAGCATMEAR